MSDDQPLDEEDLVLRLLDRDDTALVDLQQAYGPFVLAMLARHFPMLRPEDRDEVYCDAVRKVWERIETYDDRRGSLRTWFFAIARNAAIDCQRSRAFAEREKEEAKGDVFWEQQAALVTEDDAPGLAADPRVAVIRETRSQLTGVQRAILDADANCLGTASTKDLAAWLGMPPGTIRVERHRARAKVKAALERAGFPCPDSEAVQ